MDKFLFMILGVIVWLFLQKLYNMVLWRDWRGTPRERFVQIQTPKGDWVRIDRENGQIDVRVMPFEGVLKIRWEE